MDISQGWEVAIALAEYSMGVRSSQSGGDTIQVYIREYEDLLSKKGLPNTAENYAKLMKDESKLKKAKWGNVDVWYVEEEWSDYTSISGYADFDDDYHVYFDVRQKFSNGTLEEFNDSEAWKIFVETLVIDPSRE